MACRHALETVADPAVTGMLKLPDTYDLYPLLVPVTRIASPEAAC